MSQRYNLNKRCRIIVHFECNSDLADMHVGYTLQNNNNKNNHKKPTAMTKRHEISVADGGGGGGGVSE